MPDLRPWQIVLTLVVGCLASNLIANTLADFEIGRAVDARSPIDGARLADIERLGQRPKIHRDFEPSLVTHETRFTSIGRREVRIDLESPLTDAYFAQNSYDYWDHWDPYYAELRSGWPFIALRGTYCYLDGYQVLADGFVADGVKQIESFHLFEYDHRPTTPILVGQLGNTVFYGFPVLAVVVAITQGVRAVEERARAATGRCPGCLYDWRDLERCPECGRVRSQPLAAA